MLDSLGVYQHHDGITGTAQQHVADDYHRRIQNAIANTSSLYDAYLEGGAPDGGNAVIYTVHNPGGKHYG